MSELISREEFKKALYKAIEYKIKWTMESPYQFSSDEILKILENIPTRKEDK